MRAPSFHRKISVLVVFGQNPVFSIAPLIEKKMTKGDQFRQYAEEAMRWAFQSKTQKEKQAYIDLAHTWTQAAVHSEHIFGVNDSPPEARTAL